MKKTPKVKVSQEQKAGLKILRAKGLWKPEKPRAPPTRYALSLLRKYSDVTHGQAAVVTVKGDKKNKGYKEAAAYKSETREGVRVVRNKIIVPKNEGEKVTYSKKDHRVHVTRSSHGVKYRRTRLPFVMKTPHDYMLKKNERFTIPFVRGNQIDWYNFTQEEFEIFWNEYVEKEKERYNPANIQIVRVTQSQIDDEEEAEESGERHRTLSEIWNSAPDEVQTARAKKGKAAKKK